MHKLSLILLTTFATARTAYAQEVAATTAATTFYKIPDGTVIVLVVVVAALTMIIGMYLTFRRLKELNQGFGSNSLKGLGLILFLPTLLIVSVTVTDFKAETIAALLGTVAGYVLSQSKADS